MSWRRGISICHIFTVIVSGVLSDATKSVSRAYINNFQDKGKQVAIDMFVVNIHQRLRVRGTIASRHRATLVVKKQSPSTILYTIPFVEL